MARPTFVFFGGKGGVGKTTVASAFGLRCSREGLRTLLVSTDPAHSTGDVFEQEFGDEPRPVADHEGLDALEIDPERAVDEHFRELERELGEQLSSVVVNEVGAQLELAHQTPGAHEAALFDRFTDVMRDAGAYDRVVFDTAPTGGTLRLLALPELLEGWIDRLLEKRKRSVDLYERAAIGDRTPRRVLEGDPIVDRLEARQERFSFAGETLRNDAAFALVMNPDRLSLRETERAIDRLEEYGLSVAGLVINQVTPEPEEHERGRGATYLRRRNATERARSREARESLEPPVVAEIEARVDEVTGDLLVEIADELRLDAVTGSAEPSE